MIATDILSSLTSVFHQQFSWIFQKHQVFVFVHFSLLLLDYVLCLNFFFVDIDEATENHRNCVHQLKQRNTDTSMNLLNCSLSLKIHASKNPFLF